VLVSVQEIEEHFEMSDGFNIFARRWKPIFESNKTIVCIHGLGGHSGRLEPICQGLAAWGIETIGLDLRGFGNSKEKDLPRGDTKDFNRHMQDITDTISLLHSKGQNKKLYLLGFSLGGLYALWFGSKCSDALDGLIIVAPAIEVKPRFSEQTLRKYIALLQNYPETMIDALNTNPEMNKGPVDPLRTTRFSIRYCFGVNLLLTRDNPFRYAAAIKKPTLLIQGEADQDAYPNGAKRLFDAIAFEDKTLSMLPNVNHLVWIHKEQVCAAITDWLKKH
jgi:alpha-beta hydrolase superfamily lysophospholipase